MEEATKWLSIGLALGLGIAIVIILNNIANKVNTTTAAAPLSSSEVGMVYTYDEKDRLKSITPIKNIMLKPI